MAYGSVDSRFVIFPAGPADAEALAAAHVTSWRETYRGLLPDAYLARMSEAAHARRFAHLLLKPGPDDVTLAAADRWGRKAVFMGGLALFTVASAACGLAPTAGLLIAARGPRRPRRPGG